MTPKENEVRVEIIMTGYYYECTNCDWQGLIDDATTAVCPECGEKLEPTEDFES